MNLITNKFKMDQELCAFYAKRNIIDYIWKSARMEGVGVTYPDTEAIYNGMAVKGVSVDEIVLINNLKYAWRFILESLSYPADYAFICEINRHVGSNLIWGAGKIRNIPVNIGGTDWTPDLPIESHIKEELSDIFITKCETDLALSIITYLMRKQIFTDGNKRTALLTGNHIMIRNGLGIISIPIELHSVLFEKLLHFYKSNDAEDVKQFLYDNCIFGY